MPRLWSSSLSLVLLIANTGTACAGEQKAKPGLAIWDTGPAGASAPTSAALTSENSWQAIPQGEKKASFSGDVVLRNGGVVVVVRKDAISKGEGGVEVHSAKPDGAVERIRLRLVSANGETAARLERVALVENTKTAASLEATFKSVQGTELSAKFRLKHGAGTIQIEPGVGASRLRVETRGRFVVLPDFFADDIAIDAVKLPLAAVDLPSENFVLHLTAQGDAIAMCVFENRQQDVKITLAGSGQERVVTGSEIGFEGKKVWVALLEAPRIWHMRDLTSADTGKIVPLEWRMPFAAQWRVDFTRAGDLTDSWEMLLAGAKGTDFIKPSWLGAGEERLPASRRRWNTVLGTYAYPCWSDADRQGFLQPIRSKVLQFQGPVLVYPINRVKDTPLDAYTVVDVMRNTLGVGPCEHILDLEGQKAEYRGRATCSVRDKLNPIYANKNQVKQHAEVDKTLDEGLAFVKHIRGRITRYVEFGHKMRAYLAEQQKAHPESLGFITEMDKLVQEIDQRVAARSSKIKTPEHVAKMNEAFRKDVLGFEGPDALQRCQEYTRALVVIGDNQDELSGECRWVVKTLRQRAGILMALDARRTDRARDPRANSRGAA